jgi:hypothetical protein
MRETIHYKSGDGESWLESYYINGKKQELASEKTQEIEDKFHHIIWLHDHDDDSGNGKFEIVNGTIISDTYQKEES